MSFITVFEKDLHTTENWIEGALAALYQKAPALETTAAAILKYAGPALQTIVTVEAGQPAGTIVGKVVADAQAGLTAASAFIYDYGANPSAASITQSVVTNLSGLLSAAQVTNPNSVATVTKVVNSLNNLTQALAAAPVAPAPAA